MDIHWERNTWQTIEKISKESAVVIVPVGSVEQHGHHCPIDTDSTSVNAVAVAAAEKLFNKGIKALVCPQVWYGYSKHHMDFPGTITVSSEVLEETLVQICKSILHHGFTNILILNGHGGNIHTALIAGRRVGEEVETGPRPVIAVASYWDIGAKSINAIRESPPGGIAHAGEFETSMQLYLREEYVKKELIKDCTIKIDTEYLILDLTYSGPVGFWHNVKDVSETGACGDPTLASKEKGERFFNAVVSDLAEFLEEFKGWKIGEV